jgi:predicted methyltransferase
MRSPARTALLIALGLALAGTGVGIATAGKTSASGAASQISRADAAKLAEAIAGTWRDPKNSVRDQYRHPQETLAFFDVDANDTVLEITPGAGGWYSEILAPYLRDKGVYIAAMTDPMAAAEGRSRDYQLGALNGLKERLAKHPGQFDKARIATFNPREPKFAEPGTVDTVLTFRNVHNWTGGGLAEGYFKAFFEALKPGGTLGVVDHRAAPGTDAETMRKSGYVTEDVVIKLATDAGFVLDARSEVNANPKDTKDHPNGVWTLPPTNRHEAADAAKFSAIGESDRMTLRFVKPKR